jgi:hypothetical protein
MRIIDKKILDASAVIADTASEVLDVTHQVGISVQVDWTSTTAAAVLTLQASNDGITWVDLASTVTVNNNSGMEMLYATDFHYKFARVEVDWTSGSITTLSLQAIAKGF